MKDTCAISLSGSAIPLLRDRGDVVMATARYGRGTVFAAVDPWLYNEYTDGRKTPPQFTVSSITLPPARSLSNGSSSSARSSPAEQKGNP